MPEHQVLTMCECGHAAIHHYSHGRCGVENEICSCLNLVPRDSEDNG
jgi:hypothetical protein